MDAEQPDRARPASAGTGIRLERWRAARLWARAAMLEQEERRMQTLDATATPPGDAETPAPDAVELDAAIQAAIESGMDPTAVRRAARLELVLGALDPRRPGPVEGVAARLCAIPAEPLTATGTSPLAPRKFLAAFEAHGDDDQHGLSYSDSRELGGGAELRIYRIAYNVGYETRRFRDVIRMRAAIPRIAVTAEPDGQGGTVFEIVADTRASARAYGRSLGIAAGLIGGGAAFLGHFIVHPSVSIPLGLAIGAGLSQLINRLIAHWAFPAARKELRKLARNVALRSGGQTEG